MQAARLALRQGICLKRQAARAGTGTAVAAASAQKGRHVALAADAHAQRAVHEALGLDAAVLCDMLHLGHAQLTGQHHAGEAPCRLCTLIWVEPWRGSCGAILPISVATARS